jgi:hypothetical protein
MAKSRKKARKPAAKRSAKKARRGVAKRKGRKASKSKAKRGKARRAKPRKQSAVSSAVQSVTDAIRDMSGLRGRLAGHNTFED